MSEVTPEVLAFGATAIFSLSCLFYTLYSQRFSAFWVNTLKTSIAALCFGLVTSLFFEWHTLSIQSLSLFFISGFAGLGIGDLFLLLALTRLGAARTLIVFGFGPLFTGFIGYWFLEQKLTSGHSLAILFLLACLFIFSYERYKEGKGWELKGVIFALSGVFLDSFGIGLTRGGFELSPQVLPLEANFYRSLGALLFFIIYSYFVPLKLISNFKTLDFKQRITIVLACLSGTFLSLWLWNTAVKWGHLATISAIGVTGPFLAAFFECVYYNKMPSRYLLIASIFFSAGVYILLN